MPDLGRWPALLRADLDNVRRDALLLPLLLATPLLVLLLRFGFPPLSAWLGSRYGIDLEPHRAFVLGALLVIDVPITAGAMMALLVLDERAQRTLTALAVTPLGLRGYVTYRFVSATVLAVVLPALALPLADLLPPEDLLRAAPALLPAALLAPLSGCLVLLLASNPVEGLGVMKGAALLWALPLLGWFVEGWWVPVLALIPTGAALHVLWSGIDGAAVWPLALAGTGWSALLLMVLWTRVSRRVLAPG
jgi:fluoroquinolone transport system permease protein